MLQTQPLAQRHSAYDNMPRAQHQHPRTLHYTTASQQVTSPVSHFVSSRNEPNLKTTGRHSADQFYPSNQGNVNGRRSADQIDGYHDYQSQYNNNQEQRMFSSQQNLSTYQQPGNQWQPVNGYYGIKHISPARKPTSHISRRDQADHPSIRQQLRPKSSDDIRWENYLGIDKNGGTLTLDNGRHGDQHHDTYPMERFQTEDFRNVSSSWENLYDSADLTMVPSESPQV